MRARNMQALADAVKRRHPGVVVYGKGDEAHALRTSDHNEDDTSGVRAAQSDADSNPEHRAIDIMLGAAFTRAQAYALIADLLADPTARARLFYILFNGWRWSRSTGWARVEFDGDPHDDHIHISGWAADDENAAGWPAVEGDDMAFLDEKDRDTGRTGAQMIKDIWWTLFRAAGEGRPEGSLVDDLGDAAADDAARDAAAESKLDQLLAREPAAADVAAFKAALTDPATLQLIAKAVADEDHARSAG